ncbi:DMT family transporter [Sediminispirochaeta bajacaliforniensis]|uniref:DMT family transporter n=1 Tax=Sediminispirochaeta bajacaliforniensis TaxID=148 RepID=UPI00036140A0|nr:DMT family transporter [Sediminispirochaeta bajacaliforniensis]
MKNDLLLLTTAAIWGFAFVAQRSGMAFIGPHTYNALRFFLGALSLFPLFLYSAHGNRVHRHLRQGKWFEVLLAGLFLFGGSALQQMGIVYTSAGKAGFITGFYVVLVPLLGGLFGLRSGKRGWTGAILALSGLYFLSVHGSLSIAFGDLLVMISALFFASHVLYLSRITVRFDPVSLSIGQYLVCAVLSLAAALFSGESIDSSSLAGAFPSIAYGGIMSVGVAYSLQIVAQRRAHPTHAAIILCMESLFAALGGALLLSERLSSRELFGAALMFAGMLVSQVRKRVRERAER